MKITKNEKLAQPTMQDTPASLLSPNVSESKNIDTIDRDAMENVRSKPTVRCNIFIK